MGAIGHAHQAARQATDSLARVGFFRRLLRRASVSVSGVDRIRIVGAAAIVVAAGFGLWATGGFTGGGEPQEPQTSGVLTTGAWIAGQAAGEWAPVAVPLRLSGVLASVDDVATGVAARDLPVGALVTAGDIVPEGDGSSAIRLKLSVDASLWPGDGPQAGDTALLIEAGSRCATRAIELLGVNAGIAVVAASPSLAAHLSRHSWEIVEAPDGSAAVSAWLCRERPQPSGSQILLRVAATSHGWPAPGPAAADVAMFIAAGQDCAAHIGTLADVDDGSVTLVADRVLFARLQGGEWTILPAPDRATNWQAWGC